MHAANSWVVIGDIVDNSGTVISVGIDIPKGELKPGARVWFRNSPIYLYHNVAGFYAVQWWDDVIATDMPGSSQPVAGD